MTTVYTSVMDQEPISVEILMHQSVYELAMSLIPKMEDDIVSYGIDVKDVVIAHIDSIMHDTASRFIHNFTIEFKNTADAVTWKMHK